MGFAEGMAAGQNLVRGAIGTYYDIRDGQYRTAVQADNLDKAAQAKADRDYMAGLQTTMANAAGNDVNAPAADAPAPAASFTDLTSAPQSMDPAADATAQGGIVNPYATRPAADNTLAPMANSLGDAAASMRQTANPGMVAGTAPSAPGAGDTRPLWQRQADGYTAGANYALKNGRYEHAAELLHGGVVARTQAGGEAMKTGLQSFMTTGDTGGLVDAFNIYGDGITAKSFTQQPDGTYTLTLDNKGKPQQMAGITKDQVPSLVAQYADPAAAYQRQVQAQADQARKQFETNEDIRKETAKSNAERVNRAPTITMQKNADGSESPIVTQPTTTGYSIGEMGGGAQHAPTLSQNDVKMHSDIFDQGYKGMTDTMQMMSAEDKVKVDTRVGRAQTLYDSNRDNPSIGAMNPSRWLALADDEKTGVAKRVEVADANGVRRTALVDKGVIYTIDSIPLNSPANANRPTDVPAVFPKGSPFTPGAALGPAPPPAPPRATTPGYPSVSSEVQATRDSDSVTILKQELVDQQAKLSAATAPEDRRRAEMNVAAVASEIAKRGGAVAPAARAPVNMLIAPAVPAAVAAPPVSAPPATASVAPVAVAPTKPQVTTRLPSNMPAAASEAKAKGAITLRAQSSTQIAQDTNRLAEINQQIATIQVRSTMNGGTVPQNLIAERDAIKARLNQSQSAQDEADRQARASRVHAITSRSPLVARNPMLQ